MAGQVGRRGLDPVAGSAAVARIVHPRAAALAGARIQVEVELADQAAIAFDPVELHVRVPDRRRVGLDLHRKQALHHAEQAVDHFRLGEVLLHFLFGKRVTLLAQLFRRIGEVPGFQRVEAELVLGELAQFGQVAFGKRARTLSQILQKADHLIRAVGHLRHQRHLRIVVVAEQPGFFGPQLE